VKLAEARIGWSSYSPDFSHPGDRRRFAAYARRRGLEYEHASLDRPYDVVLITHASDLPGWIARKRTEGDRLKLVFELIDSYLEDRSFVRRYLKGAARFALGTESRLSLDFLRTLALTCAAADVVICSTVEQRAAIKALNDNVHVSFDWFGDELGPAKTDYARTGKLRLVWEGQSTTSRHLHVVRQSLNALANAVELHLVTDSTIPRFLGRFGAHDTLAALPDLRCDVELHEWRRDTFAKDVRATDVAILPIGGGSPFAVGKPENKLVMLWKLGMPVIASATPAYERAMGGAGLDLICKTDADWQRRLTQVIAASPVELGTMATTGRAFAERNYGWDAFAEVFDRTFASVGFEI
jgi:hypothetical protein